MKTASFDYGFASLHLRSGTGRVTMDNWASIYFTGHPALGTIIKDEDTSDLATGHGIRSE